MKKFFGLILLISGCAGNPGSDVESVKKIVDDYYDGIGTSDRQKMIDATTGDFIVYEVGKVWTNDSVFNQMDKYKFTMTHTLNDFEVTIDGQKAYANYNVTADFVFDDTLKEAHNFIESAAFVKKDGNWKMDFLQVCERGSHYDTIAYAPGYYARRLEEFKKEKFDKGGTVVLGNSIVEYGNWRKLFADSSVVNRGVAADNTFGVLNRLDEVIERQPERVILEIGINDVSQNIPVKIIVDNIVTIVRRIRSASVDTKIYVVSLLPTNDDVKKEYPDAYNKNKMSDVVNARLRSLAVDGSFAYVDLNTKLLDSQGKLDRKFASADGLHLNEEGYRVFADAIHD